MSDTKRDIVCKVRLTKDELQLFQQKSLSYGGNMSALIRDAVCRFDDERTRGKIESMKTLLAFYNKYQQQLSWLGGNFNQCMHRANELAITGGLTEGYFHSILMPEAQKATKMIRAIKAELDDIHDIMEQT